MQKVKVFTKSNNNIKENKYVQYIHIHANQQERQWNRYSLFSVYQVDGHEKYKS